MKRLFVLSATIVLAALTGCEYEYTPTDHFYKRTISSEERSAAGVRFTEFDYDENNNQMYEKQTFNGRTVYEDTDMEYNNTSTLTKTYSHKVYDTDGVTVVANQNCVESFVEGEPEPYKFEAFDKNGSQTDPVERREWSWDSNGRPRDYVEEIGGEKVLQYRDWKYEYNNKLYVTYTREERDTESGTTVTKTVNEIYADSNMRYIDSRETKLGDETLLFETFYYAMVGEQSVRAGYKIYAGGNDKTGTLIEEMSAPSFSSDGLTATWTVTYRGEGAPRVTEFKETYELFSIKF